MFTIKGRYSKLGLEKVKYTEALDTAIKTQIRQAAREWLKAVILRVPIWTGTSIGSLQPLGAYLRVAVPNKPRVVRFGMGPSIGRNLQEFSFGKRDNVWYFEFTEEVPHYLVNEYFNANVFGLNLTTPGPYRSFYAGEVAFENYIANNLAKRIPRLNDYVVVNEVRVDG